MALNRNRYAEREAGESGSTREPGENELVPVSGKYRLRFLPRNITAYSSKDGDDDFGYKHRFHFCYIRTDGTKEYNIVCPRKHDQDYKTKCPICEEGYALFTSKNSEDKKLAKGFYRQYRTLLNVLDLSNEESVAKGVQWYDAPTEKIYLEVRKYLMNPEWDSEAGKDILDIAEGKNFSVEVISKEKSGTGFIKYVVQPEPKIFDATPYLIDDWRERVDSLIVRVPKALPIDEIKELISCDEPVEEKPSGSSETPPPPPKAKGGQDAPQRVTPLESNSTPPPPPGPKSDDTSKSEGTPPPPPKTETSAPSGDGDKHPFIDHDPQTGRPICFGEKYAPKSDPCKVCPKPIKMACREKILSED